MEWHMMGCFQQWHHNDTSSAKGAKDKKQPTRSCFTNCPGNLNGGLHTDVSVSTATNSNEFIAHDGCSELVTIAFFFSFTFSRLNANFFVILFKRGQIFACFTELTFFHAFTNIPMDERTLRIHQIEFVVDAREYLSNGRGVADHAAGTHHLGQITSWNYSGWLVVDAAFESSRRPIGKLDCAFGLDGGTRGIHI